MADQCILTSSPRQLHGKLGRFHLHSSGSTMSSTVYAAKALKPHPNPLPIIDHSLNFFKNRFITWSPTVFITSSTTYLESHSFCRKFQELISIKPMQEHFASLWKIIDKKDHLFPNFLLPFWDKKISFLSPRIVYPPPSSTSNFSNPP